jgi:5-oxoprolinase (ATP-hydrolysing)
LVEIRGITTCIDAYLTPLIKQYVKTFMSGFDEGISNMNIMFMMNDGGLCDFRKFEGFKSILSGPAGGVVGYALTAFHSFQGRKNRAVIGFDMGGTSTDVSRYDEQAMRNFLSLTHTHMIIYL